MPESVPSAAFDIYHVYWFLTGLGLGLIVTAIVWIRGKLFRPVEKELTRRLKEKETELRDLESTLKIDLKQRVPVSTELDLEKRAFEEQQRELAAKVSNMEAELAQAARERSRLEKDVAGQEEANALNENLIKLMKAEVRDFAQLWAKLETRFREQAPYGDLVAELRDFDDYSQLRRLPVNTTLEPANGEAGKSDEQANT